MTVCAFTAPKPGAKYAWSRLVNGSLRSQKCGSAQPMHGPLFTHHEMWPFHFVLGQGAHVCGPRQPSLYQHHSASPEDAAPNASMN